MLKTVFATSLALAFCVTTAALAQSTAATNETSQNQATTETAQPNASDVESQLSLGEDADKPEDLGQTYIKETIGAWEMRCIRTEAEEDPCQMYQMMDDGNDVPVAEISLFRLPNGGKAEAGATVIVPLETSLPSQLRISIDGGTDKRYPYAFCDRVGCYARIGLTSEDVNAFKRGRDAVITLVPALAPDQKVRLKLSLDGFTASYEKVSILNQ